MQVKTLSVTYGRKVNLGNYESGHIEVSIWADLDEGEDEAQAAENLRQMARNQTITEMARMSPELAQKLNGKLASLPMGLGETMPTGAQLIDEEGGYDALGIDHRG